MYDYITKYTNNGLTDLTKMVLAVSDGDAASAVSAAKAVNVDLLETISQADATKWMVVAETYRSLVRTWKESRNSTIQADNLDNCASFKSAVDTIFGGVVVLPPEMLPLTLALLDGKYQGGIGLNELDSLSNALPKECGVLRYAALRTLLNHEVQSGAVDCDRLKALTRAMEALTQYKDEAVELLNRL